MCVGGGGEELCSEQFSGVCLPQESTLNFRVPIGPDLVPLWHLQFLLFIYFFICCFSFLGERGGDGGG